MQTFLNAAGQEWDDDQLGLAVNNAAVASGQPRIALATAASAQILGAVAKIGPADPRGQVVGVACTPGEIAVVKVGATLTPGSTSPFLTSDANGKWVPAAAGEAYAMRVLYDGRAVYADGDEARCEVQFGTLDKDT